MISESNGFLPRFPFNLSESCSLVVDLVVVLADLVAALVVALSSADLVFLSFSGFFSVFAASVVFLAAFSSTFGVFSTSFVFALADLPLLLVFSTSLTGLI